MSQKNTPSMDLSALSGFFNPNSKAIGVMSGSAFMPQAGGPIQSPMNIMNGSNNGLIASPMNGLPGTVPKTLTNNRMTRNVPSSLMRQNMMGKSPFFPFGGQ